jgi:hypothetical protein
MAPSWGKVLDRAERITANGVLVCSEKRSIALRSERHIVFGE